MAVQIGGRWSAPDGGAWAAISSSTRLASSGVSANTTAAAVTCGLMSA